MNRHSTGALLAVLLLTTLILLPACDGEAEAQLDQARAEAREWQTRYENLAAEHQETVREVETLETETRDLSGRIEDLRDRAEQADELRETVERLRQRMARLDEEQAATEAPGPTAESVRTEQYPVEQVRARLADAGTELFSAGQYGAARAVLLSALELGDESTDTLYRLAYSEAASDNLPAAAEHYEACLDKLTARAEPDNALLVKCLTNAGVVAQRRGELEEAAELYERAVAVDERHAPAYFNLGVLYLRSLERPEDGVEALTRHIALGGERAIAARRLIREAQQSQGE